MRDLTLLPTPLAPLPLGALRPAGWLARQLQIQADGLGGHLHELWPDIRDSAWGGGAAEGWERAPYWLDGFVPLAFLLGDARLIAVAHDWVDRILALQHDDGWLGPVLDASDVRRKAYDPWPVFVALKALTQYQEATGDARVIPAMLRFCRRLAELLDTQPLFDWGRWRWPDLAVPLFWLYERTGAESLLELADAAYQQRFDWRAHFAAFPYHTKQTLAQIFPPEPLPGGTFPFDFSSHVVNNTMGIKQPGVWSRLSHDEADAEAHRQIIDTLDRYHGQATGVFSGDEHLAGFSPSQGTELCAVVEYMYSLEVLLSITADPWLADRLERIAYNALPATFTPDMWAHQYVQQVNQVQATSADDRVYTNNGPDANCYGLEPNFGCCTANMHQGWPKFAASLWMRSADGFAAISYAPCALESAIGGAAVSISVGGSYPFAEQIPIVVEVSSPVGFALALHIPAWADGATIAIGGTTIAAEPGGFARVERTWNGATELTLTLPMAVERELRQSGGLALRLGPLLLALPIEPSWELVRERPFEAQQRPGHPAPAAPGPHDWQATPASEWAYALAADVTGELERLPVGDWPFSPEGAPLRLLVQATPVPAWGLEHSAAAPVPPATPAAAASRQIALIPYGATNLRIGEFPVVG